MLRNGSNTSIGWGICGMTLGRMRAATVEMWMDWGKVERVSEEERISEEKAIGVTEKVEKVKVDEVDFHFKKTMEKVHST